MACTASSRCWAVIRNVRSPMALRSIRSSAARFSASSLVGLNSQRRFLPSAFPRSMHQSLRLARGLTLGHSLLIGWLPLPAQSLLA